MATPATASGRCCPASSAEKALTWWQGILRRGRGWFLKRWSSGGASFWPIGWPCGMWWPPVPSAAPRTAALPRWFPMTSAPFSPPPPSAASTPTARRPTSCTRGIFCHAPGVQPSAFPPPAPPTPPVPWSAWWQPGGVWRRTGEPLEMGALCAAASPRTSAVCRGNSASPASLSPTTLRRPSWWRTESSGWRLTEA